MYDDCHSYPPTDLMKPLEFDESPFEGLGTHKEAETLQLPLMVMLGSHVPDEAPEPIQIRVSLNYSPLSIILSDASSSQKAPDLGGVSLNTFFHPM